MKDKIKIDNWDIEGGSTPKTAEDTKRAKRRMIDALEKALIKSGHTKAYAKTMAKKHYQRFLGCKRILMNKIHPAKIDASMKRKLRPIRVFDLESAIKHQPAGLMPVIASWSETDQRINWAVIIKVEIPTRGTDDYRDGFFILTIQPFGQPNMKSSRHIVKGADKLWIYTGIKMP